MGLRPHEKWSRARGPREELDKTSAGLSRRAKVRGKPRCIYLSSIITSIVPGEAWQDGSRPSEQDNGQGGSDVRGSRYAQ